MNTNPKYRNSRELKRKTRVCLVRHRKSLPMRTVWDCRGWFGLLRIVWAVTKGWGVTNGLGCYEWSGLLGKVWAVTNSLDC